MEVISRCLLLILVVISLILTLVGGDDEFEGLSSLTLEHTFDSGPNPVFTKRGTISIRSLKTGNAQLIQDSPMSAEEIQKLKTLAENDDVYRVRLASKSGTSPGASTVYVTSFIKACLLYESELSHTLSLNVDQSGVVMGISMTTYLPYCEGYAVSEGDLEMFNTTVDVIQTSVGPVPETQIYIQRMEQEKAEKAKGQQADNRSFFAKYWMYLVPLFIFLMFASSNADPNQGGGGGR